MQRATNGRPYGSGCPEGMTRGVRDAAPYGMLSNRVQEGRCASIGPYRALKKIVFANQCAHWCGTPPRPSTRTKNFPIGEVEKEVLFLKGTALCVRF